MSEYSLASTRGQKMLTYLPGYYSTSRIMNAVLQAQGAELDELRQALDETLEQFFVDTATWGIDTWEDELGLAHTPEQPDSERRAKIKSRIRGVGTCTIKLVKEVAESYENGIVDVVEDFTGYVVTIQFVDNLGVPPNLNDLQSALRVIVPAHLDIQYQFRYTTYGDIKNLALTYGALKNHTYGELKTYRLA